MTISRLLMGVLSPREPGFASLWRDYRTTGLQDDGTTGRRDDRTTELKGLNKLNEEAPLFGRTRNLRNAPCFRLCTSAAKVMGLFEGVARQLRPTVSGRQISAAQMQLAHSSAKGIA